MPPKTNGFWMFAMATTKGMSPEDAKRQASVMWESMGEEKREEWRQKARAVRAKEKGILAGPSDRFVTLDLELLVLVTCDVVYMRFYTYKEH